MCSFPLETAWSNPSFAFYITSPYLSVPNNFSALSFSLNLLKNIYPYLKVNNENVGETSEFMIDPETGEVRAKIMFDREMQDNYELVLVARDHGTPVSFETLRFVTVKINDINDHMPIFEKNNVDEDVR